MSEPLPGTSKANTNMDEDGVGTAMAAKQTPDDLLVNKQDTDLTTIVPVKGSSFTFLDPYFGLLVKENNSLGINSISVIESDFAALVLSGDKQIVRNGRVINSYKVSSGNKQYVMKTSDVQKREMNYLSHISKKYSPFKKGKHATHVRGTSQKAILKQSLLNFVVSNEWFAPQKPVLTLLSDSGKDDNQVVKWMDLKSCTDRNTYSSPLCTSDGTTGFRSSVRSSLSKEKSNDKFNVPVTFKTWNRDTSSNMFLKTAAIKSFGQKKKIAVQQTYSDYTGADDITMNELAGYFDNLVHIPKEMSSMAKMMYQ